MDIATPNPDLRCFRCGYSLAGLGDDRLCPECSLPITRSIDAARFRFRPIAPERIVRVLRTIAALDVVVFVLPIALAFSVYSAIGGPPTSPGVFLTALTFSPIVRSVTLLYLWRITSSCWYDHHERPKALAVFVVCGRIATTAWLIAGELFQQVSMESPIPLVVCIVFAACEAMTRRTWLRRVSRALGEPPSADMRSFTRIASIASWPLNIATALVLMALWDRSIEYLAFLPIVVLAHLVHAFCLWCGTITCAEAVRDWNAARVEPCES